MSIQVNSKLIQTIHKYGYYDFDCLEFATVIATELALLICVGIDDKPLDLDASDVLVSKCLTDHTGVIVRADGTRESKRM